MAIIVQGLVFNGAARPDNFTGGGGNDVFNMTADDWVTDYINGGSGWDRVDYSTSQTGTGVNITLTDGVNKGPSGGTVTADFNGSFLLNGKGLSINKSVIILTLASLSRWRDSIIPIAVERMPGQINGSNLRLRIGDLDALGVFVLVQLGADRQASVGRGRGDQLDYGAIAAQRLAAPVDRDERE